jgi:hypothetical protein
MTTKLTLACPLCGSTDITYACEPKCCFNHVCGGCLATFEPVTRIIGGGRAGFAAPETLPDACDPTVACAKCESVAVYVLDDGRLACHDCGASLELEFTEVTAP